jgi:phytoene dehydrogenase-like protein
MFDACKQHIEERGGSVELKTPTERLEVNGSSIRGVWVNSELQHADHVVLALPPNELSELLKDTPISGLETERLQAIRPTMGVAIDLGVMGLENNHIGTIELPELNGTLGIHNLFEPSLAPAGGHLFQFLRFMTPAQMQDKAVVEQTEPLLLNVLEGIWPGFRDKIVMRRTLVRNVLTAATHRYDQPRPSLLPVKVDAVEGLYLAGDATASAGELSNSAGESAIMAAGFIANRAGLGAISL